MTEAREQSRAHRRNLTGRSSTQGVEPARPGERNGNAARDEASDKMNSSEHDPTGQAAEAAEHDPQGAPAAAEEAEALPEDAVGQTTDPETASSHDSECDEGDAGMEGETPADSWATDRQEAAPTPQDPEELRAERDRARDRHLRLAADFDNYRKRTEGRLRQRWDRAQADLVSRMLEPLDDLLRVTALEPESASVEAIVEGVDLVERKFFRVLDEAGVEVVDPEGEEFDPNTMEAMMSVPAGSEEEDDTVERVFQRGYTFKGLLVRPARVSVYKA